MATLMQLFCLVDGESTSNAFSVEIDPTKTISDLKKLIKTVKTPPRFDDIAADELTLWRISIPVVLANKHRPVVVSNIQSESKIKLDPKDDLSDVFEDQPPKETIHILVQRPPPGKT
ncbi:hypothetical protein BGZ74_009829 [Mortierella antarctica]|nr:hypothetical protein BGZ74_009829 [Mortierella antarctica]KAG0360873.1 hypothetical protein BG005_009708 [Podila minutissima]